MPTFEESKSRLRRADKHRVAFIEGWNSLLDPRVYTPEAKINSDGIGVITAVRNAPVDYSLALELGEFFYQLRAALDGLFYTAVILMPEVPPNDVEEHLLQFPICRSSASYDKSAKQIISLPRTLLAWIESVQPYNSAQTAGTPHGPMNCLLDLLNDCARKDRHRHLHLVASVFREIRAKVQ